MYICHRNLYYDNLFCLFQIHYEVRLGSLDKLYLSQWNSKTSEKCIRVIRRSNLSADCRPLFIQKNILALTNPYIFYLLMYIMNKPDLLSFHYANYNQNSRRTIELLLNSYLVLSNKMISNCCIKSIPILDKSLKSNYTTRYQSTPSIAMYSG